MRRLFCFELTAHLSAPIDWFGWNVSSALAVLLDYPYLHRHVKTETRKECGKRCLSFEFPCNLVKELQTILYDEL